jgi:hypothetical protein
MAKVYLSAKSPELLTRTWGELIQLMADGYSGPTANPAFLGNHGNNL